MLRGSRLTVMLTIRALYVRHLVATDSDCIDGLAFYICCRCKTFSLVGVLPQPVDFVQPALHPAQQLKKEWKKKSNFRGGKKVGFGFHLCLIICNFVRNTIIFLVLSLNILVQVHLAISLLLHSLTNIWSQSWTWLMECQADIIIIIILEKKNVSNNENLNEFT